MAFLAMALLAIIANWRARLLMIQKARQMSEGANEHTKPSVAKWPAIMSLSLTWGLLFALTWFTAWFVMTTSS